MHIWNLLVSLDIDMFVILVDPFAPNAVTPACQKKSKEVS